MTHHPLRTARGSKSPLRTRPLALLLLLSIVVPFPASSGDGVVEINQVCATETGCTAGDAPGFPVTLDTPGSYRLTSNLTAATANQGFNMIEVSANHVSLDLGGFMIQCTDRQGGGCQAAPGLGRGVDVQSGFSGVSVRNGTVSGMGGFGMVLRDDAEATRLRVLGSQADGIDTGRRSRVEGNVASGNSTGIAVGFGSTVIGNTASGNRTFGIIAGRGSTVSQNAAFENSGDGINADGATISDNAVADNTGDGIQAGQGSTVGRNTARDNGQFGLRLGATTSYHSNTVTGNGGTVSSGINRGGNFCDGAGSAFCP